VVDLQTRVPSFLGAIGEEVARKFYWGRSEADSEPDRGRKKQARKR